MLAVVLIITLITPRRHIINDYMILFKVRNVANHISLLKG